MPSRDPGEDDLPEDHPLQACQEDQVCPAAPKNKQKISSCNGQSLQNIRGRGFLDTFLSFPSCERLQRGESVGKAAGTCRSPLMSVGRVVPASWDAAGSVPAPHTDTIQQRELHRGRRGMRHQAAVPPSGHHAAQVGGYQTTGLTGPSSARSLVTDGEAINRQRTSEAPPVGCACCFDIIH